MLVSMLWCSMTSAIVVHTQIGLHRETISCWWHPFGTCGGEDHALWLYRTLLRFALKILNSYSFPVVGTVHNTPDKLFANIDMVCAVVKLLHPSPSSLKYRVLWGDDGFWPVIVHTNYAPAFALFHKAGISKWFAKNLISCSAFCMTKNYIFVCFHQFSHQYSQSCFSNVFELGSHWCSS